MSEVTDYQHLIHQSRYARWLEDKGRRETWSESVQRYVDFWEDLTDVNTRSEIYRAIHDMHVMPSMRALWSAGDALRRDNAAGYNCAYVQLDNIHVFSSVLWLLCCGTGVGFSVERQHISKLPEVAEEFHDSDSVITVADSKEGWARAFKQLISMLYAGEVPKIDVSKIRPAGARLATMGGRASGPQPLVDLFDFTIATFKEAAGRRLNSAQCHDILTYTGLSIVLGGVRRSAMLSLGNVSDERHRNLKTGAWYDHHGNRALANNSAAYDERPDFNVFQNEMKSLYESYSGERGIFNRGGAKKKIERLGIRDPNHEFGGNPCCEIILRGSGGLCNLTEVIIRHDDTLETLKNKVATATIMGTLQSTLTHFPHLPKVWQRNAEEERLLGVSFTGICDHEVMSGSKGESLLTQWLTELRAVARATNKKWAKKLGINESAAITTVKPSGTVSQLCDTASGIHPRFSKHYIRTIRQDRKDPLTDFLIDMRVPHEPCVMNPEQTVVFSFPIKAPKNSVVVSDVGPIEQLELARIYGEHWADHTVSLTAYYTDESWYDVCSWIWKNFDSMVGMSFLPFDGGSYKQAPYQEIDEATYKKLAKEMPDIDWSQLKEYERGDTTEGAKTLACVAGACELV